LAAAAGLPVDPQGRLVVDGNLRVLDHATIYAAGDAAATGLRMACATAMPMGAYVADHLAALLNNNALPAPFQFGYLGQCISLGRHDGLVQFVHADDTPKPRVLTGWIATRIKELICRFTVWSLFWEKRWPGLYSWSKTRPILVSAHATVAAGQRKATAGEVTAGQVTTVRL
jgi:NADH dehydrogenase FAD-containing subunit